MGPSPMWRSNITRVKQTVNIIQQNIIIMYISLVIYECDLMSPVKRSIEKSAYTCANHVHST